MPKSWDSLAQTKLLLSCTILLHPLRPALIKNKQQLPAGHPPGSWLLGPQNQFLQFLCLHSHFAFESKLVEARNITSSLTAGFWPGVIYLLSASVSTLPLSPVFSDSHFRGVCSALWQLTQSLQESTLTRSITFKPSESILRSKLVLGCILPNHIKWLQTAWV